MKQIPIVRDARGQVRPAFAVTLPLGNRTYTLSFHWNARAETWLCDLALAGVAELAFGIPVRAGDFLFSFYRDNFPAGYLFVADRLRTKTDPGRYDLGDRVRIYFIGPEEM